MELVEILCSVCCGLQRLPHHEDRAISQGLKDNAPPPPPTFAHSLSTAHSLIFPCAEQHPSCKEVIHLPNTLEDFGIPLCWVYKDLMKYNCKENSKHVRHFWGYIVHMWFVLLFQSSWFIVLCCNYWTIDLFVEFLHLGFVVHCSLYYLNSSNLLTTPLCRTGLVLFWMFGI